MSALRSQTVSFKPIRNPRTGSQSFRVMGTIKGEQRKKHFSDEAEARQTQNDWELERILGAAATRPKITSLTQTEIAQAQACVELLKGTGHTLVDAVRHLLANPLAKPVNITFRDGYKQFLTVRKIHFSETIITNLNYPLGGGTIKAWSRPRTLDTLCGYVEWRRKPKWQA